MVQLGNLYFIKQSFFDLIQDNTLPINKPDDENQNKDVLLFMLSKLIKVTIIG